MFGFFHLKGFVVALIILFSDLLSVTCSKNMLHENPVVCQCYLSVIIVVIVSLVGVVYWCLLVFLWLINLLI